MVMEEVLQMMRITSITQTATVMPFMGRAKTNTLRASYLLERTVTRHLTASVIKLSKVPETGD